MHVRASAERRTRTVDTNPAATGDEPNEARLHSPLPTPHARPQGHARGRHAQASAFSSVAGSTSSAPSTTTGCSWLLPSPVAGSPVVGVEAPSDPASPSEASPAGVLFESAEASRGEEDEPSPCTARAVAATSDARGPP